MKKILKILVYTQKSDIIIVKIKEEIIKHNKRGNKYYEKNFYNSTSLL